MTVWVAQVALAEPPMRGPLVNFGDELTWTFAVRSQCFEGAVSVTHSVTLLSYVGVAVLRLVLLMKIYSCWLNAVSQTLVLQLRLGSEKQM